MVKDSQGKPCYSISYLSEDDFYYGVTARYHSQANNKEDMEREVSRLFRLTDASKVFVVNMSTGTIEIKSKPAA